MGHALACNNVFINDSIAVPPDGTIIHHMREEYQNKIETCGNAKITVKLVERQENNTWDLS